MQTTRPCWPDRLYTPTPAHAPPIGEPMRSLLRHRLDDLERRLLDMSLAINLLLRETSDEKAGGWIATGSVPRSRTVEAALSEVRTALARFEDGSYGLCGACGAPIEPERLASRPQIPRCSFCEQQG